MTEPPSPFRAREVPEARLPERIGRFGIEGVLGRGGMGVVFDAHTPEGQRVALKVIQAPSASGPGGTLIARFLREARILGQLDHPGVVRLVDAGDIDGTLYLAMERIEGVSLLSIRRQGPLGFEPVVQLGVHIADALAHMHAAGVVHRDIKPANILIKDDGQPVITDFGISGMSEATGITRQGDLLGSPGFMAPEVVGGQPPTARSDQYALGRLLFELGARGPSRRLPRKAPIFEVLRLAMEIDWSRFPADADWPALAEILRRMLAHAPEARFADASLARDALEQVGRAVLDSETLSEHVDQLDLPSSTSYEALAEDLLSHPPEADPEEGDDVLRDLELPVGFQPRPDAAPTRTWAKGELPLPRPPGGAEDFLTSSDPEAPAEDTRIEPPPEDAPPAGTVLTTSPPEEPTRPPPPPEDPPPQHDETVPLELAFPRGPALDAPTDLGLPLSRLLEQRESSAAAPPTPEATELDRLERALARARDEIAQLRRALADKRPPSPLPWVLVSFAALIGGLILGSALSEDAPPEPPRLVLVPRPPGLPAEARYGRRLPGPGALFEYGKAAPPTSQDRRDARHLLEQAEEHLEERDLEGAERMLGLCIEVADLPDCHRTLGTLLTLTRHPAARPHFRRYLELAPDAPDAAQIRAAVEGPPPP